VRAATGSASAPNKANGARIAASFLFIIFSFFLNLFANGRVCLAFLSQGLCHLPINENAGFIRADEAILIHN
jgi:hypothetical protein